MKKFVKQIMQPSVRLCFLLLLAFALATLFLGPENHTLAYIELGLVVLLFIFTQIFNRRRSNQLLEYLESVTYNVDLATKDNLANFPLPLVMYSLDNNNILYSNEAFMEIAGTREHFFELRLSDAIPDLSTRWLSEGKRECPDIVTINGRQFKLFGNVVRTQNGSRYNYTGTLYFFDVTDHTTLQKTFDDTRPIFAIITMDNYDELIKGLSEKDKSAILSTIDDRINTWTEGKGGYLSKYDRDRYLFLFEAKHLQAFLDDKFSLLDTVRALTSQNGIQPTISIGIGMDGVDPAEGFQYAALALDMALSRGGDQAVIKNRYNFEFYGGHSSQLEKRTKVKSRVLAGSLSDLMRDSSGIYIMGHRFADLDCVGAAIGLCCAARKLGKPARIINNDAENVSKSLIERISTLPEYAGAFVSPDEALLAMDGNSLLIVVDTNRPEQVESESLLLSANKLAVIDHHRRSATYIQNAALSFHEPYASSTCELVTELLQYMVDPADILRFEAEALLSGIVLDTKNFALRTGGRTFDAAAFLRRSGADTVEVKKLLQSDMETAVSRYSLIQHAQIYRDGIAIAASENNGSRISAAQAADELLNISGVTASFVIYQDKETVNISARSMSDINVQVIVEKLGGGGNRTTAGAQLKDVSVKEAVKTLLGVIDDYLANNTETA